MSKKLKETPDRVWLAGLGALAVAEQEGNDLFQQLVKKGREVREIKAAGAIRSDVRRVAAILDSNPVVGRSYVAKSWTAARTKEVSPLLKFLPNAQERDEIDTRQARRLAAARRAFLKEFGTVDRPVQDWERLQRENKIFTVTHRGATYVPSFQFNEKGKPRPAIAKVIQILGKDTSDWGLALWFTAASERLDGRRPVDLLSSQPDQVVQAAEQEAAELVV